MNLSQAVPSYTIWLVVLGSPKSFFQLDHQVDVSLCLTEAIAYRYYRELAFSTPSWCTSSPISFWLPGLQIHFILLEILFLHDWWQIFTFNLCWHRWLLRTRLESFSRTKRTEKLWLWVEKAISITWRESHETHNMKSICFHTNRLLWSYKSYIYIYIYIWQQGIWTMCAFTDAFTNP